MAVDFAYRAKARQRKGVAIRNLKLRMFRKLIYVSEMLSCFACQLGMAPIGGCNACNMREEECLNCLRTFMCRPPLEVLSDVLIGLGPEAANSARKIVGAYNEFIGILADDAKRDELESLVADDFDTVSAFDEARRISHQFRDGLLELFFDVPAVARLTRIYGVF